jgi:hypothetical protein
LSGTRTVSSMSHSPSQRFPSDAIRFFTSVAASFGKSGARIVLPFNASCRSSAQLSQIAWGCYLATVAADLSDAGSLRGSSTGRRARVTVGTGARCARWRRGQFAVIHAVSCRPRAGAHVERRYSRRARHDCPSSSTSSTLPSLHVAGAVGCAGVGARQPRTELVRGLGRVVP